VSIVWSVKDGMLFTGQAYSDVDDALARAGVK